MKKLYLTLLGLLCIQGLFLSRYLSTIGSEKEMQSRYVVLEALYPTDKVEELFKKFPKGFSVVNMRHYQNRELLVEVEGDSATGQVTGVITQKPIVKTGENDPEEYKKSIYFDNGKMKMADGSQVPDEFKDFHFLFQTFHFSQSFFDTATCNAKKAHRTPGTTNYFLSYRVKHEELARYIKKPADTELLVSLDGDLESDIKHELKKGISIETTEGRNSLLELIRAE
jgi:hypothetical protein